MFWIALGLACSDSGAPNRPSAAPPAHYERADAMAEEPVTLDDVAESYANDLAREPVHTEWSGGDADAGAALFVAQCSVCHGPNGSGDGPGAIALNPKPRDFRDGTFYIDANANNETGEDVDLARVILEGPGAFGGSNAMTGWKNAFNDDEVRDVVAYIRTLERR
jgi:mono/diheme cytochrome c family protein